MIKKLICYFFRYLTYSTTVSLLKHFNILGHLLIEGGYIENCFLQKQELNYPSGIKPRGKALLYLYVSNKPVTDEIVETPNYLMFKELLYKRIPVTLVYTVTFIKDTF